MRDLIRKMLAFNIGFLELLFFFGCSQPTADGFYSPEMISDIETSSSQYLSEEQIENIFYNPPGLSTVYGITIENDLIYSGNDISLNPIGNYKDKAVNFLYSHSEESIQVLLKFDGMLDNKYQHLLGDLHIEVKSIPLNLNASASAKVSFIKEKINR